MRPITSQVEVDFVHNPAQLTAAAVGNFTATAEKSSLLVLVVGDEPLMRRPGAAQERF